MSDTTAVLLMRKDGSKQFFPGCHIAGYWGDDIVLSRDVPGNGSDAAVAHREPSAGLARVEVVRRAVEPVNEPSH